MRSPLYRRSNTSRMPAFVFVLSRVLGHSVHRISPALLFGVMLLPFAGRTQSTPPDPKRAAEFMADAEAGLKTLQAWYAEDTGLWNTTNWWNAANAITVIDAYSKLSPTPDFHPVFANTFERNSKKNFLNDYY